MCEESFAWVEQNSKKKIHSEKLLCKKIEKKMYSQSTNSSCRESAVTSLNNSFWLLICDTTERVHVLPVTAIPGPMAQCLCPLPASSPLSPLWTILATSLQQFGRLQGPPSSWEAEKPHSKARRAGFQCREAWPWPLAMESGRRVPPQQGLGQGLRRTGMHGKLCTPMLFTAVWLTFAILLLFYQERHFIRAASFFRRP